MTQVIMSIEKYERLAALDTASKVTPTTKDVVKSIDTDKRLFTALTLRPNVPDAHGDTYNETAVEDACHSFNEYCRKANLQHLVETSSIVFVESFIVKADHLIGETQALKGDWIQTARIDDDELWQACLDGLFTGFSIGATATVEDLA